MTPVRYVLISPARNEGAHIRATIESVLAQTIQPAEWVIVNDGSNDQTGVIAGEFAAKHSWIKVLNRPDRGFRRAGGGVMEAFNAGLNSLTCGSWEYLVKLDADVTFEPEYFEKCFAKFAANPRLGVGGGLICNELNGGLVPESKSDPAFHVRGATKIYKWECWNTMGGLVAGTGWDTIDEIKANMLGWQSQTFQDIRIVHHRPAGEAYGVWPNWVKNGYANYATGYHPLFMFLKCAQRIFQRPYGIAAAGLCVGFVGGYIKRSWRVEDPQLIAYLRRQQMQRLLGRSSLWDNA